MPQQDKGKQFYEFVSSKGIKVPDTYEEFSSAMQDTAKAEQFHSFVSSKGIKVPELNSFMGVFGNETQSPEKKNPVVSSSQDGSQDLQDSQQPLSREPETGTAPLLQLPPVTDIVDIDLEKGVVKQSTSKIDEQLESEAVKQAGLKPGEYKKSIFNASKMKDMGEIEAGIYIVDGQPVSGENLRDKLFDTKWVEEAQKGQHTIEINPKNNELVASLIDPEIVALRDRNLQSGTRLGDKADMLLSGAYRAGSGVAGVSNLMASTFEEITGIPFTQNIDAMASKELSEDLVEKAQKQEEKVFQYKEGFVNSIMAGRYADAWQQGMNATAASIPYSATAAATTYAAGPVAAFAVLSPMGASSEFADMNISEDEAYKELSNSEKLARAYAVGTFEAGADMVAGRALTRSFDMGKSFWRGVVKEAFEKGGEEAAQKSAEEISKNIVRQHFKNIGMQGTEEYIAEGSSQMAQMFVDDLMGIREYSVADYLKHGNEAGLIGAFSGVTMTSITGSPTVISSKGIDASQKIRGYYDNILRKDSESVLSQIDNMSERGVLAGVDANVIKSNVESRAKAVRSVPEELLEDTETIDKVQKKQQLEDKKSELDPVFQGPVQEEIDGLTEEIVSRSNKEGVPAEVEATEEGAKKEITPTETKADQEKAAPEQKVTPKEEIEPKTGVDQKPTYDPPLTFTQPTDEKYSVINRNDGKGDLVLTKEEHDAEMLKFEGKPKKKAKKKAEPSLQEQRPFASSFEGARDISGEFQEDGTLVKIGDTEVIMTETPEKVTVESVMTPESKRGQGSARKAMESVLEKADEQGLPVELKVGPWEGTGTTKEGLISFYESLGFKTVEGDLMRREPKTTKTQKDAVQEQEITEEKELPKAEKDKKQQQQEKEVLDTPEQIRSKITELVSKVDEAADNFELDRVAELNAQIDELSKQLPEETVPEQEFTEEEATAALEERESQVPKETMGEVEESFTPISIAEYEKYKGKGMYKENKKFLKGLVTEEGSSTPIDTRDKPNSEDVEYFDPEDIIAYVDAVASDKAGKGFTDKRIPKEKRARRKQPTKREVTADAFRAAAKRLREGKTNIKGKALSDPTLIVTLVAEGMDKVADAMEAGAKLLEHEKVDIVLNYVRNHPAYKKLSATERRAADILKFVLGETGIPFDTYRDSLIKAARKKESKAKTEGRKEGRQQEKLKEQKKAIKEEIERRGNVPNKYSKVVNKTYEEAANEINATSEDELSGIMNELVPEDKRGQVNIEKRTVKETLERGKALVDNGTINPYSLVTSVLNSPRPITPDETAAMVYHKAKLDSEVDSITNAIDDARANGDVEKVSSLQLQLAEVDAQIDDYHKFQEVSGYEQGLSLRMRQLLITREFEIANQVRLFLKETGRKNVPKDVMERFKLYDEAVKELNKRLQRYEDAKAEQGDRIEILSDPTGKRETKKERAKRIASNIRRAKFTKTVSDLSKLQSDPTGLFKGAWDGAIEVLATTIEAGGAVADAIEKAVEHLKKSDWYKALSKDGQLKAEGMARKGFAEEVFGKQNENVGMPEVLDDGTIYVPDSFVRFLISEGFDTIETATAETLRILNEDFGLELTERQVRDAITNYGKRSELSKDDISVRLREMKRLGKLISALEDVKRKKRPMRSGVQRDRMTQKERELKREINALLKEIPQTSEELESQWKTALDGIKQRLKNRIEDLNEQIATGKKTPKKKSTELDAEAKYLKEEIKRLSDILRSIEGKPELSFEERVKMAEKSLQRSIEEYQRRIAEKDFSPLKKEPVSTPKIEALREKQAKLRQEYNELAFDPDKQAEKRDSAALKRIQKEIDKVRKQLDGEISLESKKEAKAEYGAHVKAAQKILDSLRGELKQTEEYQKEAEKKKLDFIKKNARSVTQRYKERIANKDFAVKKPKKTELDEEARELKIEQQRWKNKFELEREKFKLDQRSTREKITDAIVDIAGMSKSLLATADLSAPGRQGAMLGVMHPMIWGKAWKGMFKQAFSEEAYERWMDEVVTTEEYAVAKRAGLYIATPSARLTAKEEDFVSGLAQRIPGYGKIVRGSERAYSSHLNILRMEVFNQFYHNLQNMGLESEKEAEVLNAMARFINNASGRGKVSIGKEDAAPDAFMSFLFFSPRFVASRFNVVANTLTGYAFYPSQVRKEALKTVLGYATVLGTVMALAALSGAEVEEDPRSADFGKIRWNGFTYDTAAGFLQVIRVMTTIGGSIAEKFGIIEKNVKITRSGIEKELNKQGWGQRTAWDEVYQFFRMKLSPAASAVVDLLSADANKRASYTIFGQELEGRAYFKNVIGEDQTIPQRAFQMTAPIWTQDIQEVYQEEGVMMIPPAILPDIFGVGTQYIGQKTEADLLRERNRSKSDKKEELSEKVQGLVKQRFGNELASPKEFTSQKLKMDDGTEIGAYSRYNQLYDSIIGNDGKQDFKTHVKSAIRKHNVGVLKKKYPAKFHNIIINDSGTGFRSGDAIAAEYADKFPRKSKMDKRHLDILKNVLTLKEYKEMESYFRELKSK